MKEEQTERWALWLSYDGTDFCGWQKQGVHASCSPLPSLQETVEKALENILNQPIQVSASGRTDAGVHALAQVAHFDWTPGPTAKPKDLAWALRSQLPDSICVKEARRVSSDFHATLSALHKTYRYWIWNSPRPTALLRRYSWWLRKPLNLEQLQRAADCVVGRWDFASFRTKGTEVRHTVREILKAEWSQSARTPHLLEFRVTGTGFLKQMVRNLVGTQVDLLMKDESPLLMGDILLAKNRQAARVTAPPEGLFLESVKYPQSLLRPGTPKK